MATFSNKPVLNLDVDAGANKADARVTGRLEFEVLERTLMEQGLEITVGAKLFGADPANDDDLNVSLSRAIFTGTQPREVDYILTATRIAGSTLNEDVPGKDEIFATVNAKNNLTNSVVASRDSNVVEFFFRNN